MSSVVVKILALAVFLSLFFSSSESRSLRHFSRSSFSQPHSFARRPLQGRFIGRQGRGRKTLRQGRQEEDNADTDLADDSETETESPLPRLQDSDADVVEAPSLYGAPLGDTIDSYQGDLPGLGSSNNPGSGNTGGSDRADDDTGAEGSNSAGDNEDGSAGDARSGEIPPWCNPLVPMGAWLNHEKVRDWCIKQGFEDLSPYSGAGGETEETTTVSVVEQ